MGKKELKKLTISEAHARLVSKEISSVELTEAVFESIDENEKHFSCFISLDKESALGAAKAVDKRISLGEKVNVLAGIPVAIKDNILVEGQICTAGSKILEHYVAPYDATVIKRLKEREAVIVGKTNLDEFAMGSSTENSAYGPTKNPCGIERVPGGSSGGSAAAVAADECIYALGSDTGGSIRQPASFCGIVGLKTTYGAVSRYGLIAMASSLDQIGPITKTVEDAAIVFEIISGKDVLDSTSIDYQFKFGNWKLPPLANLASGGEIGNLTIGVPKEYFIEGIDKGVEDSVRKAISDLEKEGARVEEISLPHTKYALACYYIIMPSEVSANLSRYDGIKYGESKIKDQGFGNLSLMDIYLKTRQEGFGDEVRRRIMLGTYALSAGYYDAYYLKAQKVRSLIRQDFEKAFERVDVIITPTAPTTAFKFGEKTKDPLSMYLSDVFTVSVNLAGVPAISIPCGEIYPELAEGPCPELAEGVRGLPVGLQIIGRWFDEKTVFGIAKTYEQIRDKLKPDQ